MDEPVSQSNKFETRFRYRQIPLVCHKFQEGFFFSIFLRIKSSHLQNLQNPNFDRFNTATG